MHLTLDKFIDSSHHIFINSKYRPRLEYQIFSGDSLVIEKNPRALRNAWKVKLIFSLYCWERIGYRPFSTLMFIWWARIHLWLWTTKNYHLKTLILNHDIFHLEMLKNHVNSACKAKTRQIIAHKNIINWNKNMYTKL